MQQVLVKGGKALLETVPPPAIGPGMALVAVRYSLISTGTESSLVAGGGEVGLALRKARDPLNMEKVKRKLATVGVKGTLDVIKSKLFEHQVPGYSTAGVIVRCGADVPGFRVGDRVACAGVGYASHAEYNAVPHQLLTPLPDGVDFDAGAFVALGAIAMQGVRRAGPTFGETVVVQGLGLVGLLALQIARAAGCRVIGCDPVPSRRDLAMELGAACACAPENLAAMVHEETGGFGADAVVVCAASKGSEIANQAIECCRPRGRVSVVGAVGMNLQRQGLYHNEIDFSVSCSYGPGRYQPAYEEKGLDYPIGHVRWTEGRNMAEFLRMVAEGKVRVAPLVSDVYDVAEAPAAYDALTNPEQRTIATLLRYPVKEDAAVHPDPVVPLRNTSPPAGSVGIAVVGAGGFAKAVHLPNMGRISGCHLQAVVSRTGASARQSGDRFGARYCSTDLDAILADEAVDGVLIATRHHLHGPQVLAALDAGKHVFVEKPLALTVEDCEAIVRKVEETGLLVAVGFNRRFAPHARAAKAALGDMPGPRHVLYRCNAGPMPPDHWVLDPEQGGGRILGEAVHFFDFCCWLLDATPVKIQAEALGQRAAANDLAVLLRFPDGSVASVIYSTVGSPDAGKERIEIHGGGKSVVIDDFKALAVHGMPSARGPRKDNKGHAACLDHFVHAVQGKETLKVTAADGLRATRIAHAALEAARGNSDVVAP